MRAIEQYKRLMNNWSDCSTERLKEEEDHLS